MTADHETIGAEVTRLIGAAQDWARTLLGDHTDETHECQARPLCGPLAAVTSPDRDFAEHAGRAVDGAVEFLVGVLAPERPAAEPTDREVERIPVEDEG